MKLIYTQENRPTSQIFKSYISLVYPPDWNHSTESHVCFQDRGYAAKVIKKQYRAHALKEIEALNKLYYKKLISLVDAFEKDKEIVLILEMAQGELVRDHFAKKKYYMENDVMQIIDQLVRGVRYMHDRHYAHLNLNVSFLTKYLCLFILFFLNCTRFKITSFQRN